MTYRQSKPQQWDGKKLSQGYIADYKPFTTVDGEGLRNALYVSGCLFQCTNCFNKNTWSFKYGEPYTQELENQILEDLHNPYLQGISFLGGEPFLNSPTILPLMKRIRSELPDKTIWTWTGYTLEQLLQETSDKQEMLTYIDVLVDGPYIEEKKLKNVKDFKGSENQRILNIPKSLQHKSPILYVK